jgi:hypothetical protein
LAVVVLGALSLAGLGVGWSALNHANSVAQQTQAAVKQQNDALGQRLAKTEDLNQQLESDLKVVTDKLNVTQADLIAARKQNKMASVTYSKKLNELGTNVNAQLATKANAEDVNKLGGDVTGVKTDLDATKNNLEMAQRNGYVNRAQSRRNRSASPHGPARLLRVHGNPQGRRAEGWSGSGGTEGHQHQEESIYHQRARGR